MKRLRGRAVSIFVGSLLVIAILVAFQSYFAWRKGPPAQTSASTAIPTGTQMIANPITCTIESCTRSGVNVLVVLRVDGIPSPSADDVRNVALSLLADARGFFLAEDENGSAIAMHSIYDVPGKGTEMIHPAPLKVREYSSEHRCFVDLPLTVQETDAKRVRSVRIAASSTVRYKPTVVSGRPVVLDTTPCTTADE